MDVGFDNFVFLGILVVLSKSVASDVSLVLGISVFCLFAVDKVVSASHHESNVFTVYVPSQNDSSSLTITICILAGHRSYLASLSSTSGNWSLVNVDSNSIITSVTSSMHSTIAMARFVTVSKSRSFLLLSHLMERSDFILMFDIKFIEVKQIIVTAATRSAAAKTRGSRGVLIIGFNLLVIVTSVVLEVADKSAVKATSTMSTLAKSHIF